MSYTSQIININESQWMIETATPVAWGIKYTVTPRPLDNVYYIQYQLYYRITSPLARAHTQKMIINVDGGADTATLNLSAGRPGSQDWYYIGSSKGRTVEPDKLVNNTYTFKVGVSAANYQGTYNLCPLVSVVIPSAAFDVLHPASTMTVTTSNTKGIYNYNEGAVFQTYNNAANDGTKEIAVYWNGDMGSNTWPSSYKDLTAGTYSYWYTFTPGNNKYFTHNWIQIGQQTDWRNYFNGHDYFTLYMCVYTYANTDDEGTATAWGKQEYTYTIWRGSASFNPVINSITVEEDDAHIKAIADWTKAYRDSVILPGLSDKKVTVKSTRQYGVNHSKYKITASTPIKNIQNNMPSPSGNEYTFSYTFTNATQPNYQATVWDSAGNNSTLSATTLTTLNYVNQSNNITECYVTADGYIDMWATITWTPTIINGFTNHATTSFQVKRNETSSYGDNDQDSYSYALYYNGSVVETGTTYNNIGNTIVATAGAYGHTYKLHMTSKIRNFDQSKLYDVRIRTRDSFHSMGTTEYTYAENKGIPCAPVFDFSYNDLKVNVQTLIDNDNGISIGNGANRTSLLAKIHNNAANQIDIGASGGHIYLQGSTDANDFTANEVTTSAMYAESVDITNGGGLTLSWGTNAYYHEITNPSGSDAYAMKVIPLANGFCKIAGWVHSTTQSTPGNRSIILPFSVTNIVDVNFTATWTPTASQEYNLHMSPITLYNNTAKNTITYRHYKDGSLVGDECYFLFSITCRVS